MGAAPGNVAAADGDVSSQSVVTQKPSRSASVQSVEQPAFEGWQSHASPTPSLSIWPGLEIAGQLSIFVQ